MNDHPDSTKHNHLVAAIAEYDTIVASYRRLQGLLGGDYSQAIAMSLATREHLRRAAAGEAVTREGLMAEIRRIQGQPDPGERLGRILQ